MAQLQMYKREAEMFPTEQGQRCSHNMAQALTQLLCDHFKLKRIPIRFTKYKNNGSFVWKREPVEALEIRHSKRKTLFTCVVIHEFAHYLDLSRRNTTCHDETFFQTLVECYKTYPMLISDALIKLGAMKREL